MNILIPDFWLRDYLKTKAKPEEIAECLSLCGASVEKIKKVGPDFIYDIEVTTNRVDMMSVLGIAREAAAILPRFGIKAKFIPFKPKKPKTPPKKPSLVVKNDPKLCPRFTAVVLENITIKPSPKIIQKRLSKAGMRPINNIVDITNYLMKELGQPFHAFDYQEIKKEKMILRSSKKGEKITTLDGQTHVLPGKDIVIEDGSGRLIDLCGIMGGSNSHISKKTKKILLFGQIYNPLHIRRTSMSIGKRTEAAALFEKSPDPEMVLPALYKGINLIKKHAQAKVASRIIDIYPHPYQPKKVTLTQKKLNQIMGIKIKLPEAKKILNPLGFQSTINNQQSTISVHVPSWRAEDVSIPEDLIEEIARIYGYHNLPSRLPTGEFPQSFQGPFKWEKKAKNALKYWGFSEVLNYSFVSQELLRKTGFNPQNCLKLSNPLSSEWKYLRPSLIPNLLRTIAENQSREEEIKIFELANVYLPKKERLPHEKMILTGAISGPVKSGFQRDDGAGEKLYRIKGILKALLEDLGIKNVNLERTIVRQIFTFFLWHPGRTGAVTVKKRSGKITLGTIGEIHPHILKKFAIEKRVAFFELDFEKISEMATEKKTYTPIPKYPPIIEDLAFLVPEKTLVGEIIREIKKLSKLITKVDLLDSYKNIRTFRIIYQHPKRTLTDQEVKKVRKKIIKKMAKKFAAEIKE